MCRHVIENAYYAGGARFPPSTVLLATSNTIREMKVAILFNKTSIDASNATSSNTSNNTSSN